VEPAGHAEVRQAEHAGLPGRDRIVEVAPQTRRGGQAFEVQARLEGDGLGHGRVHRAVEEDLRARRKLADQLADPLQIRQLSLPGKRGDSRLVAGVHARLGHPGPAPG